MAYRYIYIFRHGQTFYNKNHVFTGWKDSKLTPRGIKDARKVGFLLKNKEIDIAFHSGLSRSRDTLKYVLKHHEGVHVIVDPRMKERNYGSLSGTKHSTFEAKYGAKALQEVRRSYSKKPPRGENMPMVERRVNSFIKDLLKLMKKTKGNVAISAHGNSMRPFRKHFEKLSRAQMMKLENPWDNYFVYRVKV